MQWNDSKLLLATALCWGLSATNAMADCKQKLPEVDAMLADADLEGTALQSFTMIRDQAEMFCNQGQEALAMQFLSGIEQELGGPASNSSTQQAQQPAAAASGLTDQYLAGTWCAMVTQEQTQITFNANGTYVACFHDSMQGRFGHCGRPSDTEGWLDNFKKAEKRGPDEFALGNSARSTTYRRGECSEHGI